MSGRGSLLEAILVNRIGRDGLLLPRPEYAFAAPRKWRFDFAWPEQHVAAEVEGGVWIAGRHVRGKGYEGDLEKYNTAVLLGWRVLRFTGRMIEDGTAVRMIRAALGGGEGAR